MSDRPSSTRASVLLGGQHPVEALSRSRAPGGASGSSEGALDDPAPRDVPDTWWPAREEWVSQYAGGEVPARHPDGKLKALELRPGSYVKVRAED
jgi:hypothetical protein